MPSETPVPADPEILATEAQGRLPFSGYAAALSPIHWWTLDEASAAATAIDSGEIPQDGAYSAYAKTALVTSPIYADAGAPTPRARALFGDQLSYLETAAPLDLGVGAGAILPEFTLAFWTVQGSDYSRRRDALMGAQGARLEEAFQLEIQNGNLYFVVTDSQGKRFEHTIASHRFRNPASLAVAAGTDWSFVVIQMDAQGRITSYVNAEAMPDVTITPLRGIRQPFTPASRFRVGHVSSTGRDTAPEQGFDEVMIFNKILAEEQIAGLYWRGRYGLAYETTASGGSTVDPVQTLGLRISPYEVPTLLNAEDLTDRVESFAMASTLDELAPAGSMALREEAYADDAVLRAVAPGKYVVVERRYRDQANGEWGAWRSLFHALSEGVRSQSEDGRASSTRAVSLVGLGRLLTLDPLIRPIAPDRQMFSKAPLSLVSATETERRFGLLRPDGKGYYAGWEPAPTPYLTASKFQNWSESDQEDADDIPEGERPAQINIRSSQGSVDILAGSGLIRINRQFYEGSLGGGGMGNPSPDGGVAYTGARRLAYDDLDLEAEIAQILPNQGRWEVGLISTNSARARGLAETAQPPDPASGILAYSASAASGDWGHSSAKVTQAECPHGYYRAASAAGQSVEWSARFESAQVIFYAGPSGGLVSVEVDGGAEDLRITLPTWAELKASNPSAYGSVTGIADTARVIDLYAATAGVYGPIEFVSGLDSLISHTVVLTVLGKARAASSGTQVALAGFTGLAKLADDVSDKTLPRTLRVRNGSTRRQFYMAYPMPDAAGADFGAPTLSQVTVVANGGTIGWGTAAGGAAPSAAGGANAIPAVTAAFSGDGAASKAIDKGATAAWAQVPDYGGGGAKKTQMLVCRFAKPDNLSPDDPRAVSGITVKIRRWAYSDLPSLDFGQGRTFFYPWFEFVHDKIVQLRTGGQLKGQNKAQTVYPTAQEVVAVRRPAAEGPATEAAIYGGSSDLWGAGSISLQAIDAWEVCLQVEVAEAVDRTWIGIEEIEAIIHTSNGEAYTQRFQLTDLNGFPINPVREGFEPGTPVQVGSANRPEDVLRLVAAECGFHNRDTSAPLYAEIEDSPAIYQVIMPEIPASLEQPRTAAEIITEECLQSALPSYRIRWNSSGVMQARRFEQAPVADMEIEAVPDHTKDAGSLQVYTRVVSFSESLSSTNLAESAAIRAVKLDNYSTTADTSTGRGKGSAAGVSYSKTDAGYAAANARLKAMIDGDITTPYLKGGDWSSEDSRGVIWSAKGSSVWPWTWEEEPLFMLDLGLRAGQDPWLDYFKLFHVQTYYKKEGVPQAVSIYGMSSAEYRRILGSDPPAAPDQEWADQLNSYFPPSNYLLWRLLADKVVCNNGATDIAQDLLEPPVPAQSRFLLFVLHQGHYYDGEGNKHEKRMRAGFTEIRIEPSRKIVAVETLGVSPGLSTGDYKNLAARVGLRTAYLQPNLYLDTYGQVSAFARDQLRELFQEFTPIAHTVFEDGLEPGMTVSIYDPIRGAKTRRFVPAITAQSSGAFLIESVDYEEVPDYA